MLSYLLVPVALDIPDHRRCPTLWQERSWSVTQGPPLASGLTLLIVVTLPGMCLDLLRCLWPLDLKAMKILMITSGQEACDIAEEQNNQDSVPRQTGSASRTTMMLTTHPPSAGAGAEQKSATWVLSGFG